MRLRRRSLVWLAAFLALSCNDSGTHILPAAVNWMEWPAEVRAGTPFTARLVGFAPFCGPSDGFNAVPQVDDSAVTFQPYFIVPDQPSVCPPTERQVAIAFIAPSFDTSAAVPGLAAPSSGTYDMRASAFAATFAPGDGYVIHAFGTVTVRRDSADTSRTAAAGQIYTWRDTLSCLHGATPGLYPGYVIENPPDTTTYWSGFVQGYLYAPAAPVCGATKVFHLVARQ
jgi:hypothetical protein